MMVLTRLPAMYSHSTTFGTTPAITTQAALQTRPVAYLPTLSLWTPLLPTSLCRAHRPASILPWTSAIHILAMLLIWEHWSSRLATRRNGRQLLIRRWPKPRVSASMSQRPTRTPPSRSYQPKMSRPMPALLTMAMVPALLTLILTTHRPAPTTYASLHPMGLWPTPNWLSSRLPT